MIIRGGCGGTTPASSMPLRSLCQSHRYIVGMHLCGTDLEMCKGCHSTSESLLSIQDLTPRERNPESCTMAVLEMLPLVNCIKPKDALHHMIQATPAAEGSLNSLTVDHYHCSSSFVSDIVLMDVQEFESSTYQRVYQYLKRYNMKHNLDEFSYTGSIEGTQEDCLQIILK